MIVHECELGRNSTIIYMYFFKKTKSNKILWLVQDVHSFYSNIFLFNIWHKSFKHFILNKRKANVKMIAILLENVKRLYRDGIWFIPFLNRLDGFKTHEDRSNKNTEMKKALNEKGKVKLKTFSTILRFHVQVIISVNSTHFWIDLLNTSNVLKSIPTTMSYCVIKLKKGAWK